MDEDRLEQPHSPTMFDDEVDLSRKFKNVRIDGAAMRFRKKSRQEVGDKYRKSNEREVYEKSNASETWKCRLTETPYRGEDLVKIFPEQATSTESNQASSALKLLTIDTAVSRKISTCSLPTIDENAALGNIPIPIKKVSFNDLPLSSEELSQILRT